MKIIIKKKSIPTQQKVEQKSTAQPKQEVQSDVKPYIVSTREDRSKIIPFRYRRMFFNSGSVA